MIALGITLWQASRAGGGVDFVTDFYVAEDGATGYVAEDGATQYGYLTNYFVTPDGVTSYVAEDGTTQYVQEM